jgi:hypothetical protein
VYSIFLGEKPAFEIWLYAILFIMALFRARAPEWICCGTLLAMPIVDRLYHFAVGGSVIFDNVDLGHMLIDFLAFAIFVSVALRANRLYPIWIAGAQIISVIAHLYRMSNIAMDRLAYDIMQVVPYSVQLVSMGLGLLMHMMREKRFGAYRSWRRKAGHDGEARAEPAFQSRCEQ